MCKAPRHIKKGNDDMNSECPGRCRKQLWKGKLCCLCSAAELAATLEMALQQKHAACLCKASSFCVHWLERELGFTEQPVCSLSMCLQLLPFWGFFHMLCVPLVERCFWRDGMCQWWKYSVPAVVQNVAVFPTLKKKTLLLGWESGLCLITALVELPWLNYNGTWVCLDSIVEPFFSGMQMWKA